MSSYLSSGDANYCIDLAEWDSANITNYYDSSHVPLAIKISDNTGDWIDLTKNDGPDVDDVVDLYATQRINPYYVSYQDGNDDTIEVSWSVDNAEYGISDCILEGEFDFSLANLQKCRSEQERTDVIKQAIKEQIIKAIESFYTINFGINGKQWNTSK